jgi:hypothetical protein
MYDADRRNMAIKKARPGRTGNGLAPSPTSGCVGIVKEALSQRTLHCKKIPVSSGTLSAPKGPPALRHAGDRARPPPVLIYSFKEAFAKPMILLDQRISAPCGPTIYSNRMT